MNDRVDDIHSEIECPTEHYGQDQESKQKEIEGMMGWGEWEATYGEKCVNKIGFNRC